MLALMCQEKRNVANKRMRRIDRPENQRMSAVGVLQFSISSAWFCSLQSKLGILCVESGVTDRQQSWLLARAGSPNTKLTLFWLTSSPTRPHLTKMFTSDLKMKATTSVHRIRSHCGRNFSSIRMLEFTTAQPRYPL